MLRVFRLLLKWLLHFGIRLEKGGDQFDQFLSECFQFFWGQGAEKGLQNNSRLPSARIQIITKDFQLLPGLV
jgi:hypothetical protein